MKTILIEEKKDLTYRSVTTVGVTQIKVQFSYVVTTRGPFLLNAIILKGPSAEAL